jgi:hypothetical protein
MEIKEARFVIPMLKSALRQTSLNMHLSGGQMWVNHR